MEQNRRHRLGVWIEILIISARLGLTSFGGPVAHLAYFHEAYVRRRRWLDERSYADLVALCQFLPGPASSQVGIGIGVIRAGVFGGILAFIGFTLPSALVLIAFALLLQGANMADPLGWIHGLKIVAVAVVAHALIGMAKKLTPDVQRKSIALFALVMTVIWQTSLTQVIVILIAGLVGRLIYHPSPVSDGNGEAGDDESETRFPLSHRFASICLMLFFGLLILLPILKQMTSSAWIARVDSFYRAGALVFGGGHVVLPLLEREFVPTGWISDAQFLAGYGMAQAVPGPLFTFAAYLGAMTNGWLGGFVATAAIFLPAFLLIFGTLPFWDRLRHHSQLKEAFMGVNAAVVGILAAAFYQPIWTSTILTPLDFAFATVLFAMLAFWKWPAWTAVLCGAVGGFLLSLL